MMAPRLALVILWLCLVGLVPRPVHAQTDDGVWTIYLNANDVRALSSQGETVFAATGGGFVRYENGVFTQWNRAPLGLASDSLRTVTLAPDGDVWIGSETAGISIFDPEAEVFRPFNSLLQPIPGDRIRSVRSEENGGATRLLVGAEQGYAVFVDGELRFVCQEGVDVCPLPSFDVRDLIDYGAEVWLATANGVLAQTEQGDWLPRNTGLGSARLIAFAKFSGELFGISDADVWRWDEPSASWTSDAVGLPLAQGFSPRSILSSDGDLWIAGGTRSSATAAGVFVRSATSWIRVGTRAFPATSLTRTAGGTLYAGASDPLEVNDGLWELEGADWIQHKDVGPPSRASYRSLFIDDDDRLWFSTAQSGRDPLIGVFDGEAWRVMTGGQNSSLRAWTFGLLGVDGLIYLAHCCCAAADLSCRLETFREETSEFAAVDGIREAWDLARDAQGRVWVSTNNSADGLSSGLHRYDADNPQEMLTVNTGNSLLTSDQNPAIAIAAGRLWIGSFNEGVDRLDLAQLGDLQNRNAWTHYGTDSPAGQRIISNSVRRMAVGPTGDVWIGTTEGLSIVSGGSVTSIGARFDRFPTAEVTAIAPTNDGGAWIATRDGGLTRMIPNDEGDFEYRNYTTPNLPNPNITALALSRDGRTIWCGTTRGLVSFTPIERSSQAAQDVLAAYPNPFHPNCHFGVRLEGLGARASGVVVDINGHVIHRFTGVLPEDPIWDGRIGGAFAVPGLYIARVTGPRGIESVGIAVLDGPCP